MVQGVDVGGLHGPSRPGQRPLRDRAVQLEATIPDWGGQRRCLIFDL